jgi:hypothetical protein
MTDNDKKETSMAASAPIEAEAAMASSSGDGTQYPALKNSKNYYIWRNIYGGFLALVGFVILKAPASWIAMPKVANIIGAMAVKMPGLVYLVSLSDTPQEILFGYCLAWLTAPVHASFCTIISYLYYKDGNMGRKAVYNVFKYCWVFPLVLWIGFFTCLFCSGDPSWQRRMVVSSRLFVATFGQVWVALAMVFPGACLVAFLQWRSETRLPLTSGENGNVK